MPTPGENKAYVINAIETLFNQKDYAKAETYWSADYKQHSAIVPAGKEGLFNLVKSAPSDLRYDFQYAVAENDYVFLHGRYSGSHLTAPLVAVDIVRIEGGLLVEHWDVLQEEVTKANSAGGHPMFGDRFLGDR